MLTKVLAFFAERGRHLRHLSAVAVDKILANPQIIVIPQSNESFFGGLALYKTRPDKGYSLTDCVSMEVMRRLDIKEVLTQDQHFAQEGFRVLL